MKKVILTLAGALLVFMYVPTVTFAASPAETTQQDTKQNTKVFSGTIIKSGDNFILSDAANKLAYVLDNAEKAGPYEGKKVKVTGTVDFANNTIHIETIEELA